MKEDIFCFFGRDAMPLPILCRIPFVPIKAGAPCKGIFRFIGRSRGAHGTYMLDIYTSFWIYGI